MVFAFAGSGDAGKAVGSLFVVALGAGLVRASLRLCRSALWSAVGWIGVVASGVAALCGLAMIWRPNLAGSGPNDTYALMRLAIALFAVGAFVADLGKLQSVRLGRVIDRFVRGVACFTAGVLALVVLVTCAQSSTDAWVAAIFGRGTWMLWIGFAVTLVFTHLAVPILGRMEERRERVRRENATDRATLTLQCPRCLLWVQMHSGLIRCPGCSLELHVEFEEPRCGCGYPLHRLAGPNCPECGLEVPPERRWGAARTPAAATPSAAAVTPPEPA
ncbi:MAG: hypothetical protein ACKPEA_12145 [Planctomycetota bacterium]